MPLEVGIPIEVTDELESLKGRVRDKGRERERETERKRERESGGTIVRDGRVCI